MHLVVERETGKNMNSLGSYFLCSLNAFTVISRIISREPYRYFNWTGCMGKCKRWRLATLKLVPEEN